MLTAQELEKTGDCIDTSLDKDQKHIIWFVALWHQDYIASTAEADFKAVCVALTCRWWVRLLHAPALGCGINSQVILFSVKFSELSYNNRCIPRRY